MDKTPTKNSIYSLIPLFGTEKENYVLATVTGAYGSTPQKPGSSALFDKTGLIAGTVGGGAVELAIQKNAMEAVQNRKSGYFQFNLSNDIEEEKGPVCGGGMDILLDASPEKHTEVFQKLQNSLKKQIPGILITVAETGIQEDFKIKRYFLTSENKSELSALLNPDILGEVSDMLKNSLQNDFREFIFNNKKTETKQHIFLESILPLQRLFIAGAGHVGKALSHLGKLLGFDIWVWDDRPEYARKNNLPDADQILTGKIDSSLDSISPDKDTFVVIVTRDHQNDAEVLKTFISSNAGYIGMMGSKRKIIQLKEQFIKKGWATTEQWEKIYTPIGLEIHSKTVQEIAVSIAAQLVQIRNETHTKNG